MKVLILILILLLILNQKVFTLEKEAQINYLSQDEADIIHPDTEYNESDQLFNISNNDIAENIEIKKDSDEEGIKDLDKNLLESIKNLETTSRLDENFHKFSDGIFFDFF